MDLPPHAYVPGRNARHPEGAFDAIRETAQPGMDPDDLARSEAFRAGLRYLDAGYYWEAHEVLEPVWMALPDPAPERALVQGLIQLANGLLKLRMERPKAALRLAGMARALVPEAGQGCMMGLDLAAVLARIDSLEVAASDVI